MHERQVRLVILAVALLAVVVGATLALTLGNGEDADSGPGSSQAQTPEPASLSETDGVFHGSYAGRVRGTPALVAVEAAPPGAEGDQRSITLFVSDGSGLAELFVGEAANDVELASRDEDAEVEAEIRRDRVTGLIRLEGGRRLRFDVPRAAGASGLYNLDVDGRGALTGATLAGVGASGRTALDAPGKGHLDLADGRRLSFAVTRTRDVTLRRDTAHLIVLGDGRVAGLVPGDDGPVGVRARRG